MPSSEAHFLFVQSKSCQSRLKGQHNRSTPKGNDWFVLQNLLVTSKISPYPVLYMLPQITTFVRLADKFTILSKPSPLQIPICTPPPLLLPSLSGDPPVTPIITHPLPHDSPHAPCRLRDFVSQGYWDNLMKQDQRSPWLRPEVTGDTERGTSIIAHT